MHSSKYRFIRYAIHLSIFGSKYLVKKFELDLLKIFENSIINFQMKISDKILKSLLIV